MDQPPKFLKLESCIHSIAPEVQMPVPNMTYKYKENFVILQEIGMI